MQYFYFRYARKAISESPNLKQAAVYRYKKQHIVIAQHTASKANRHETMHVFAALKPDEQPVHCFLDKMLLHT